MSRYFDDIEKSHKYFLNNVAEHEMTVLLDTVDDGTPHRHIRFAKPGTGIWSFSLVTWPGHLAISGDLQDHTFRRTYDMFDFFRSGTINPSYWGEKLQAEGRGTEYGKTNWTEDAYEEVVEELVRDFGEGLDEDARADFSAEAREHLFDDYSTPYSREQALQLIGSFEWAGEGGERIEFTDAWELDFGGYSWHFLIACHAIRWGIEQYLTQFPGRFIPEGGAR